MSDAKPPRSELKESLTRLHAELAAASRVDAGARQLLATLLADIERLLREPAEEPQASNDSSRRLESVAVGFEADHPALAASVREFIDLLGRAGL